MASDRTAKRLTRILAVLPWIIEREGASTHEVVERFGYANTAELIKDLHLVFMTGLPGYGPGDLIDVDIFEDDVFVDAADYFARPLRLTPPEALGLLAAGLTIVESDQAPEALRSAVDKLIAVIAPDNGDAITVDVPTPPHVGLLREAIEERSPVLINYVGLASNERSARVVEGHSVFFNLGNWYLSGFCREADADRVFRVDRIEAIEIVDGTYEMDESDKQAMIQYQPTESDVRVSFTLEPQSSWVAEYYPLDVNELEDGALRVTMSVSDALVAARLLLQLGDQASDIDGAEVERTLESLRTRILARY
jgi:predicted DNA-binding transcriptional regulator YafY